MSASSNTSPSSVQSPTPQAEPGGASIVCFDIETKRLASSVGGWPALISGAGGIACIAVTDSREVCPSVYTERTLDACIEHLESADFVFTWNGDHFDVPLLEAVAGRKLRLRAHIDLWRRFEKASGGFERRGSRLGVVASMTIGRDKTASGEDVEDMIQRGRGADVASYCINDTDVLHSLVNFVRRHGYLVGPSGEPTPISLPERLRLHE